MKPVVALLLSGFVLFPQQPPPESPVFSVTTTLVQIDAVVTGPNGRYISGLTANDFEVFEDRPTSKLLTSQ